MSEVLPRIIETKLAAEPFKTSIAVEGAAELAKMVRLPEGLPPIAVAHQFLSDFNAGRLRPKPLLFCLRMQTAREV